MPQAKEAKPAKAMKRKVAKEKASWFRSKMFDACADVDKEPNVAMHIEAAKTQTRAAKEERPGAVRQLSVACHVLVATSAGPGDW